MPPQGRLGDKANVAADAHGCPACPHPAIGPAIQGSADVLVNGRPALRVDDVGIHAACCGPNLWRAAEGSDSVFINGKPAHRVGDRSDHCGGKGQLVEGSGDVFVGGGKTGAGRSGGEPGKPPPEAVEFSLRDDSGEPLADVRWVLTGPDGREWRGTTDANGGGRQAGLDPGTYKLRFPRDEDDHG